MQLTPSQARGFADLVEAVNEPEAVAGRVVTGGEWGFLTLPDRQRNLSQFPTPRLYERVAIAARGRSKSGRDAEAGVSPEAAPTGYPPSAPRQFVAVLSRRAEI